ncbi:Rnf-Nqr domain containing protein [Pseudomonas gingeri]|uniref:Rnf-Nqr domain containing protein n=1 Tax=Pseudomonas gingeri TaxID=117681 RepID=UPI00159F84F4|nr:Rnf-Nqr domain containing protein [Pseudomonas gingeri]NWA01530.1 NADH:quinone oxidoreductase [Pseudomonas gingeri]NWA13667.1 NADH:quinone oxidoreductase [Pseudomonas gingeri]NWA52973.1 NADH:quinone oxidoreductase [Pseudomonas gingeri]NWA96470.1 NADH:quinone oxidoreductase [Pseudomonas gingeri]NWA99893.1 NADH:quinone oxidoreductase [Pseudomonas gingeri]
MTDLFLTLVSAALINNLVLQWPLGVDPLLQATRTPEVERRKLHALGIATTWLMLVATLLNYSLYHLLLLPLDLGVLQLFIFLPLSVALISPSLKLLARGLPSLPFAALWPLLLVNAGILGLALTSTQNDHGPGHAAMLSLGTGLGFWLVLGLFNDLRQRTYHEEVPLPFRGLPIELISAGLIALAFLGFNGLLKP